MTKRTILATGLALALGAGAASAETHEVKMLNQDPDTPRDMMVFEPAVIEIEPGDTVRFVPEDRGHNAQSVKGAIPEGAEPFRGGINEAIEVTFDEEGTYLYKCLPHEALGMIGLVLVGDHERNLDAVRDATLRGARAEERLADYLERATETASAGD
jgi:pseudoazurin